LLNRSRASASRAETARSSFHSVEENGGVLRPPTRAIVLAVALLLGLVATLALLHGGASRAEVPVAVALVAGPWVLLVLGHRSRFYGAVAVTITVVFAGMGLYLPSIWLVLLVGLGAIFTRRPEQERSWMFLARVAAATVFVAAVYAFFVVPAGPPPGCARLADPADVDASNAVFDVLDRPGISSVAATSFGVAFDFETWASDREVAAAIQAAASVPGVEEVRRGRC
jgi:hypothetical protein